VFCRLDVGVFVRNNLTISYDINIICFNTSCEMEKNKEWAVEQRTS
jgi:hypothetical protein